MVEFLTNCQRYRRFFLKPVELILEGGERFSGWGPQWQKAINFGEVVFTTGMTGYVESLTDPSYAGQILTFTYPLVGNYGVPQQDEWESRKIHAAGVVVSETPSFFSHERSTQSLMSWLEAQKIPLITGVDTRELTKALRSKGVSSGAIVDKGITPDSFFDPNSTDLVGQVTIDKITTYGKGKKRVLALDCGMKENIVRNLMRYPIELIRCPYDTDIREIPFDGLFISNGPGDPMVCTKTIEMIRWAMEQKKPIFGICLGAQLLSLAAGATTYKLPYGHRGQNQPVIHYPSGKCYLTSQNHGYAVDESTLTDEWTVSFRHLNDGTVSGVAHKTLPFFAVQFHPEASPGPVDTTWLFEQFIELL